MTQSSKQFTVTRPLYSEDLFAFQHEKIYRQQKTPLDHVKAYFTCNSKRAKSAALSLLPVIDWVRMYRIKEWLLSDIVSGVSTGLVAVLQGLAFSLLASLPPGYGLYTAFFPVIVYFFLGTSRHISVGAFPVLSLMLGAVVTQLVPDDGPPANITGFEGLTQDQQRVMVAASITFLMGVFQLAMGLLQVGFIVMYLSDTLVSGFTTAAAVHILVSQLKFVLGLVIPGHSGPLSITFAIEKIFVHIRESNIIDLVISVIIMVVVYFVKEFNESYEPPMAPNLEVIQLTAMEAFPMAIVGFAVAFSVAKVYAIKHDYVIDGNQELIAFGASNIFGATFRSFAASTALSRTAVQESTGGKTQIAGLLSAMVAMVVTMAIGFLLEPLPKCVLGALVIVNLKGMLKQFGEVPDLWRKDKPDCVVWVVACASSIVLGLDLGLAVGLAVELLTVVFRTQFPRCSVLANIKGTEIYRDRKDYLCIYEPEGVKIFRIPSPIFFANIEFFREKLVESVGFNPLRVLRKRNKALRKIRKLLQQGELQITEKGLLHTGSTPIEELEDEGNTDDLDQPTNVQDLPVQVNWNAELPGHIRVPRIDVHSIILDFSAVSFLDISALKGLRVALKEFIRVDVEVYIVACDSHILKKLHSCKFFDSEIKTSIFFLTLHDAMLHILEKHPTLPEATSTCGKALSHGHRGIHGNGGCSLRSRENTVSETQL
ncbi:hypothetical protein MATL_G00260850 [Megalops atlanticus]|uniref:STAS domain-containing protein n=1 Tax=Megalops atlanticus TaxID=7932 RepID=A0A9D3P8Y8_MEGAT|nr:hypothetical protein MATL_G00260850 [Megalops atlanticus]